MEEITIKFIDREHADDINIKNQPFKLFGRMLPSYQNGAWSYSVEQSNGEAWDIFPDENYDFAEMERDHVFIGAYDGEVCVGLAIFQKQWHKYLYLYDLKVNDAYRGRHIGARMIEYACRAAQQMGYRGLWTVGQDNNLAACLFYIRNGFRIGGLDTEVYNGTKQAGKADIYFYKDVE